MNKISVLIADDMIIAIEGLKHILRDIGDIELVAFASTPEQVIEISGKLHPNVIVLDMNWYGDEYVGIKLIRELRLISPKSTIIANSAYIKLLDKVKSEGVDYILSKSSVTRQALVETIREAGSHQEQPNDILNVLFVSYSHKDIAFASKLSMGLRAKGIKVWRDEEDIPSGSLWDQEIEKALKNATHVLLIASSNSVNSRIVIDELSFALDKNKIVIPCVIEAVELPMRIRRSQWIDFTKDYEMAFNQLVQQLQK